MDLQAPLVPVGVCLEFGTRAPLIGFSANYEFTDPAGTGGFVRLEFGTRAHLIGFSVNYGYTGPSGTGVCVCLEFGTRARLLVSR